MAKTEKRTFQIDPDRLDDEWINQPDLFHGFAVELAQNRLEVETKKNLLELEDARLCKDIRDRPKRYDIDKLTENAIRAVIVQQKTYQTALKDLNDAKYRLDISQAAVTACDHRKKALENMVYLHGQNYFATPRAKGEIGEKMREHVKTSSRRSQALKREDLEGDE